MRNFTLFFILLVFFANSIGPLPQAYAYEFRLPAPGVMVHLSPEFNPPILKGIKVHLDNPFRFDFILDKGDSELNNEQLKDESSKLIKYFLASLTVPEKDLWVNLSPYEKDRIIPQSFGLTEMGRDLLAEDYMLKQITASLIYPEDGIGKKFWKRIYEVAEKKFGTTNIPVNTFNKVWIVPEKAVVYENAKAGTAYVVDSKLKVMLEQDYLSLEKHEGIQSDKAQVKDTNQLGSQVVREIVIPQLTKEVNEDKNFAQLRQVYNSLVLATWYKKKIKDSIFSEVYADKNKIAGVNINDPQEKDKIYKRYLQAFKKGVYNYIKEEIDPNTQEKIPRKYFSGGMELSNKAMIAAMVMVHDRQDVQEQSIDHDVDITADVAMVGGQFDFSMTTVRQQEWQSELGIGKEALENAVAAFPPLAGLIPMNVREKWQREIGIGKEDLARAIIRHPALTGLNPARVREDWQNELGIGKEAIANGIVKFPSFADYDPHRVREEWQEEMGIGKEDLAKAIVEFPQLVSYGPDGIREEWQNELKIGKDDLAKAIVRFPSLTALDLVRVRKVWETAFSETALGIGIEALAIAIIKHPPLAGLDPVRLRDQWQRELGISKEELADAIVRFPTLASYSVANNLKRKKQILEGIHEPEIINGLISFATLNVNLLYLIYKVGRSNRVTMNKNMLIRVYRAINKKVGNLTGQSALYWIKQNEENEALMEPLVKEVLGVGPVVAELHLKEKKVDPAQLIQERLDLAMTAARQQEWQDELGIGKEALAIAIEEFPPLAGLIPLNLREKWQRELGIGKDDLAKAIVRFPNVAGYDPARVRDDWETVLGIKRKELAKAILQNPSLAGANPAHVEAKWQNVFKISTEDLAGAIEAQPSLVNFDPNNVKAKWDEFGINDEDLARAIVQFPPMVGYDTERISRNWEEELGIDKKALAKLIVAYPPLSGYSPSRLKAEWQRELGIGREILAIAIQRNSRLVSYSVVDNLKPKKAILVLLGVQESGIVSGLIRFGTMNLRLLQLIIKVSQENGVVMSSNLLASSYKRLNKRVQELTEKNAVYWIKQNEENEGLMGPVVKEVLGISPSVGELHLKEKPEDLALVASTKTPEDLTNFVQRNGGIDLTPVDNVLQAQNNGVGIKFHIDPAMLQQLQRAPGFTVGSITIQPLKSLSAFLGLADNPLSS